MAVIDKFMCNDNASHIHTQLDASKQKATEMKITRHILTNAHASNHKNF